MALNKKALLRLADKLEGVGPYEKKGPVDAKRFGINHWYDNDRVFGLPGTKLTRDTCGTAACACGWAATDPWFRKRGFTNLTKDGMQLDAPRYANPKTGVEEGPYGGGQEFFGLSEGDFDYLFMSFKYPRVAKVTPKMVAKRIRALVAERWY